MDGDKFIKSPCSMPQGIWLINIFSYNWFVSSYYSVCALFFSMWTYQNYMIPLPAVETHTKSSVKLTVYFNILNMTDLTIGPGAHRVGINVIKTLQPELLD